MVDKIEDKSVVSNPELNLESDTVDITNSHANINPHPNMDMDMNMNMNTNTNTNTDTLTHTDTDRISSETIIPVLGQGEDTPALNFAGSGSSAPIPVMTSGLTESVTLRETTTSRAVGSPRLTMTPPPPISPPISSPISSPISPPQTPSPAPSTQTQPSTPPALQTQLSTQIHPLPTHIVSTHLTMDDLSDFMDEPPDEPPPPYRSSGRRGVRRDRDGDRHRDRDSDGDGEREREAGSGRSSRRRRDEAESSVDEDGVMRGHRPDSPSLHIQAQAHPTPHSTHSPPISSHSPHIPSHSPQTHTHTHIHTHTPPHRPHSISHTSTLSFAPSLAQTVLSLFNTEDDVFLDDESGGGDGEGEVDEHGLGVVLAGTVEATVYADADTESLSLLPPLGGTRSARQRHANENILGRFGDKKWWKKYWRPVGRTSYYRALFHLAVVNFPFAVLVWVVLVVFTVVGTTLLVALPLGALLCFVNLLLARVFARAEVEMQYVFHHSLALVAPYPPRPVFVRWREGGEGEVETGRRNGMVREKSFYKNTYAMFTDPLSYQSLFYFIVVKPPITLLITLFIFVVVVPGLVGVVTAPAVLRAVRRVGVWQAGVAIEGVWGGVR